MAAVLRAEQVAAVRHFNRTVTRRIGALAESYLGGRPLAEDRLLYEIGHAGAEVRALRARLGLDSGYTSRLLKSLTAQGLVACGPAPGDGRVRWAALTPAGRRAHAALERQSDDLAQQLAAGLDADRATRLVDAMRQVDRLLTAAATRIVPADAATPDAQWCLEQYFAEIAVRFEQGLDRTAVLTADPHEVTPPHGAFFLAVAEGRPVGCGALKRTAPGVADVKRVWVSPDVRGGGIASRLMDALEDTAASMGLSQVRLETNRALTEAMALYRARGYREVAPFNTEVHAHHWFAKDLT